VQRASFSQYIDNRYHALVQTRETMAVRTQRKLKIAVGTGGWPYAPAVFFRVERSLRTASSMKDSSSSRVSVTLPVSVLSVIGASSRAAGGSGCAPAQ
jgi:hypothetical protein